MSLINSLGAGESGLRGFQTKMDVIGNNIANVNTTGFKSRSVRFAELLNQNLNKGGQNTTQSPSQFNQVGLGVRVSSIDQDNSQGSLQNTNRATDLAINGNGFFVVNDGSSNLLSRDGSFSFNQDGKLVSQEGFSVQGFNSSQSGQIITGGSPDDIQIDFDQIFAPEQTSEIDLSGNLNASTSTRQQVSSNQSFTTNNGDIAIGSTDINALDQTSRSLNTGNTITINGTNNDGSAVTVNFQYGTDGTTLNELVTAADNAFGAEANVSLVDGNIRLNSTEPGDSELTINSISASGNSDELAFNISQTGSGSTQQEVTLVDQLTDTTTGSSATAATSLNNLLQTDTDFVAGDTIEIAGTDGDGNTVNSTFTFGGGNDGTTVGDLVTVLNNSFQAAARPASVSLNNGQISVTDDTAGTSSLDITSFNEGAGSTGIINDPFSVDMPSFNTTQEGATNSNTISSTVYDSQGNARTLALELTQTGTNEWSYEASFLNGEDITSGKSGTLSFDKDGSLQAVNGDTDAEGVAIAFDTGTGTGSQTFNLNFESGSQALTQLNGTTTANVSSQDGFAKGELIDFNINGDGTLVGSFSNGKSKNLAQVAIGDVENVDGLRNEGGNILRTTAESGNLKIDSADGIAETSVNSGFLEGSNVELADQFTEMITTQRAYQSNARVITTSDQLLATATQLIR